MWAYPVSNNSGEIARVLLPEARIRDGLRTRLETRVGCRVFVPVGSRLGDEAVVTDGRGDRPGGGWVRPRRCRGGGVGWVGGWLADLLEGRVGGGGLLVGCEDSLGLGVAVGLPGEHGELVLLEREVVGYANLIWPHLGRLCSFDLAPPPTRRSLLSVSLSLRLAEVGEGDVESGAVREDSS